MSERLLFSVVFFFFSVKMIAVINRSLLYLMANNKTSHRHQIYSYWVKTLAVQYVLKCPIVEMSSWCQSLLESFEKLKTRHYTLSVLSSAARYQRSYEVPLCQMNSPRAWSGSVLSLMSSRVELNTSQSCRTLTAPQEAVSAATAKCYVCRPPTDKMLQ